MTRPSQDTRAAAVPSLGTIGTRQGSRAHSSRKICVSSSCFGIHLSLNISHPNKAGMMDFDGAELKSSHAGVAGNENCIVQTHVIGLLALFCTLALSVLLGY